MGADVRQLKEFQKKLQKLNDKRLDTFYRTCAKELAKMLLERVIPLTPTGKNTYEDIDVGGKIKTRVVKNGGTLKRGWVARTEAEASGGNGEPGMPEIQAYAESLQVVKEGNTYVITIFNPVFYASYVEYGHRQTPGRYVPAIGKKLVQSWAPGKFMLKISEHQVIDESPRVLQDMLEKMLKEALDG